MRVRLIGAAILVGVALLPGALPVDAAPLEPSPGDRVQMGRLAEIRERLENRRALQRQLQNRVQAWTAEIEALQGQRDKSSAVLQSKRQQARALEQRLDWLVPRLLARMAKLDERRGQAAGAFADLARKSRSVRLDPRIRARMLALSPLMLERWRTLEHDAATVRARPDRAIARLAQIERSLPALMNGQQRLQHERTQKVRLRQMASDRLRDLEVEVGLLGDAQAPLARRSPRNASTTVARAEPRVGQHALPDLADARGTPVRGPAVDRAGAGPSASVDRVADAWSRAAAPVLAGAPGPGAALAAAAPALDAGWADEGPDEFPTAALRSAAPQAWARASRDALSRAAPERDTTLSTAGLAGGARSTPPLLPRPDGTHRVLAAHHGPELTIAAAPGQAVAAPVAGRVAFAGPFKSYGLLLILEHEGEYHTLLWGFARLDVHYGDEVEVGQIVGIMDARGDAPPVLHVERRRNGRLVDIAASSNGIQG